MKFPGRLVALHCGFGGSLQEGEYLAEILGREFLVHRNTLRSRQGRRLFHQGLAMTSHASALFEDHRSSGQQQADGSAQGSACVCDTSWLRSWICLLPRPFTGLGAKLSKHVDLALVGAIDGPIQWPLAFGVFRIRIGSLFEQQSESGRGRLLRGSRRHQRGTLIGR